MLIRQKYHWRYLRMIDGPPILQVGFNNSPGGITVLPADISRRNIFRSVPSHEKSVAMSFVESQRLVLQRAFGKREEMLHLRLRIIFQVWPQGIHVLHS